MLFIRKGRDEVICLNQNLYNFNKRDLFQYYEKSITMEKKNSMTVKTQRINIPIWVILVPFSI